MTNITNNAPDGPNSIPMIVVMGVTGAGKSYFINSLVGKEVARTGHSLDSCESIESTHSIETSHELIIPRY